MALSFIKSSGNIITEDFCLALASETKADYVKDKSFGSEVKKIDETIAETFEKLRERWEENRTNIIENKLDNSELRNKWIIPLLKALGYQPIFVASNIKSESHIEYQIPYKGWDSEYAAPIHMVHSSQEFDIKDKSSRTHANKSPQDCMQQFLNTSHHQWAILINGKKVRILRDFYHSITKGFLEFDLESIFETASSEQFRVLYRILHQSRIDNQYQGNQVIEYDEEGVAIETEDNCLLESFHKKSRETGVKVGNKLRDQVIDAIEKLGNGFAEDLNPDEFQNGKVKAYYAEILNIIYRLLFLMFAEQKGWLPVRNSIYARTYSLNALRERAERGNFNHDEEKDLWEGLKITFKLVTKGYTFKNGDTINAFGGQLFSDKKLKTIKGLSIKNKYLLDAIYCLSYFKMDNLSNRINYANLAIDELGSVYESLLDYEPKLAREAVTIGKREIKRGQFYLDDRGTDRKTTGSYYTDSRLVAQLIESALVPVINNALVGKNSIVEKEQALLDLKVADIACGSGAFICAALEKMGEELSIIRMGDEERPTEDQLREAKRDVLLHCIYGVDLNPMALELAKFSLWITASLPDMPMSFLDHKLKCGNSLIGATPDLIKKGIPEEAFKAVGNDNPDICTKLKKKVKKQLEQLCKVEEPSEQYGFKFKRNETDELLKLREKLNKHKQEKTDDVEAVEEEFIHLEQLEKKFKDWVMADVWTAAFFIEKEEHDLELYPTNSTLQSLKENQPVSPDLIKKVMKLSSKYNFFHYHLEFPEVFDKGGFDCLLGNPPWEKVQPEEVKFFKGKADNISNSKGIKRKKLIESLKTENVQLFNEWEKYKNEIELFSKFIKGSDEYESVKKGNLNTYGIFTVKAINVTNKNSLWGLIVQSGFATDDTYKTLFSRCIEENILVSIYDYENRYKLFDAESNLRFVLLTFSKCKKDNKIKIKFGLRQPEEILKNDFYYLDTNDFKLFNPNTVNCPAFNSQKDVDITRHIYKENVVIINEVDDVEINNEFNIDLYCEAFNMTRSSHLFKSYEKLIDEKFSEEKNKLINGQEKYLPLYESKLIYSLNSRYGTFKNVPKEVRFNTKAQVNYSTSNELKESDFSVFPRYWVNELEIKKVFKKWTNKNWFYGFRNICRGLTDYRTAIFSVIPYSAVGNSITLIFPRDNDYSDFYLFIANSVSLPFDYIVRQKLGGSNLNFFVFKQLSIVPKIKYSTKTKEAIKKIIVELVYDNEDLNGFVDEYKPKQILVNYSEANRFNLFCSLDAIYAHLYGIAREEMEYILDTFPIIKRRDIAKYGTFHTKDTVLKLYDEFAWVTEEVLGQESLKESKFLRLEEINNLNNEAIMREFKCTDGIYTVSDVARYIPKLTKAKIKKWFTELASENYEGLSGNAQEDVDHWRINFYGLVELVVIVALREKVSLKKIFDARKSLMKATAKAYPFASIDVKNKLKKSGRSLLLDDNDALLSLDLTSQFNFGFVDEFFEALSFDDTGLANRLYLTDKRLTVIDPAQAGGKPCIDGKGVMAATIYSFYSGPESVDYLKEEYQLSESQIEDALQYYN